jgi:hypothetical protein
MSANPSSDAHNAKSGNDFRKTGYASNILRKSLGELILRARTNAPLSLILSSHPSGSHKQSEPQPSRRAILESRCSICMEASFSEVANASMPL